MVRIAHHCDASSVQAANWQAVEGSCHQTAPSSNEERVDCNVGTVSCISKDQVGDAAQNKTPVKKSSRHGQQAILQSITIICQVWLASCFALASAKTLHQTVHRSMPSQDASLACSVQDTIARHPSCTGKDYAGSIHKAVFQALQSHLLFISYSERA